MYMYEYICFEVIMQKIRITILIGLILLLSITLIACDGLEQDDEIIIDFLSNDELIDSIQYNVNSFILPVPPKKDNMRFDGWFFDKEFQVKFNTSQINSYVVNGKVQVFAKYEVIKDEIPSHTVTFIANDKEIFVSKIDEYKHFVLPNNPSLEGYTFEGWFTSQDYNIPFDSEYFMNHKPCDITVYAKLSINKATINYYVLGDIVGTQIATINGVDTSVETPNIPNYTFKRWVYAGTNKPFVLDEYLAQSELLDVNVEAIMVKNLCHIYLKIDNKIFDTIELAYTEKLALPKPNNTPQAKFQYWVNEADGTRFDIEAYNASELRDDITLTAYYKGFSTTLSYHHNDMVVEKIVDSTLNVEEFIPQTKDNEKFKYWYYIVDNQEVKFDVNLYVEAVNRADLELYAKCDILRYKFNFIANNQTVTTVYADINYPLALPKEIPVMPNYSFVEWQYQGNKFNINKVNSDIEANNMTIKEMDIVALFKRQVTRIQFINNKNEYREINYDGSTPLVMPTPPTMQGKNFAGWYEDATHDTLFDKDKFIANTSRPANLILYAKFI